MRSTDGVFRQKTVTLIEGVVSYVDTNEAQIESGLPTFTVQHARLLRTIAADDSIKPAELAKLFDCFPSNISRLLRHLADRKLIHRERDPAMRSSIRLTLTEAGLEMVNRYNYEAFVRLEEILDTLSEGELNALENAIVAARARLAKSSP